MNSNLPKQKHPLSKRRNMIVVALVVCLLWGSAFTAIVTGYRLLNVVVDDVFQIMLFGGVRFLISAGLIFLFALITRKNMRLDWRGFKLVAVLGLLQTFGQYVFLLLSLRTIHPANSAVLASFNIFLTVIIAHFVYRNEKLSWQKLLGLFVGITGIIVLNGGASGQLSWTGEGFMLLSTVFGAVSGIYTKKITKNLSPYVISAYQLLIGSVLLVVLGLIFAQEVDFTITPASISIMLYLGFISATAFSLWAALLKYNKVSQVSIYKFSIPVFGVLISFFFLQESFNLISVLIAMVLVASGILLINWESP